MAVPAIFKWWIDRNVTIHIVCILRIYVWASLSFICFFKESNIPMPVKILHINYIYLYILYTHSRMQFLLLSQVLGSHILSYYLFYSKADILDERRALKSVFQTAIYRSLTVRVVSCSIDRRTAVFVTLQCA